MPVRLAPRLAPRLGHGLGLLAALLATSPALAEPQTIRLQPDTTRIDFTTYALSMFSLVGHFSQFTGQLQIDPLQPQHCNIDIDINVTSLSMADPARVRQALAPDMLDAAAFPHLLYHGTCIPGQATGMLTLHGVSRPLQLTTARAGDEVHASGSLLRQDFGIAGMPGLVGRTIRIGFRVRLPPKASPSASPSASASASASAR